MPGLQVNTRGEEFALSVPTAVRVTQTLVGSATPLVKVANVYPTVSWFTQTTESPHAIVALSISPFLISTKFTFGWTAGNPPFFELPMVLLCEWVPGYSR